MTSLIPEALLIVLRHNGLFNHERIKRDHEPMDHKPVVKLFVPWTGAVWLISEVDPQDDDLAFGLLRSRPRVSRAWLCPVLGT
jgi:hypothetical protein